MCSTRENCRDRRQEGGFIAVAIDKDKASHLALKWVVDHMRIRNQSLKLVYVNQGSPSSNPAPIRNSAEIPRQLDAQNMDILLPLRCYCTRKQVQYEIVVLEDMDVTNALIAYVFHWGVDTLVLGASSRNGFSRLFRTPDVATSVLKWAPDFCSVYIISKGKFSAIRSASRPVPAPLLARRTRFAVHNMNGEAESEMSFPTERARRRKSYDELSLPESDIPKTPTRPSTDSSFLSFYENLGSQLDQSSSSCSNLEIQTFDSLHSSPKSVDLNILHFPYKISFSSPSSHNVEEMKDEMRRLDLEPSQTTNYMYHAICKAALAAKQRVSSINRRTSFS